MGYSVRRQRAMGGRQRDSLSVLPWGTQATGYHAGGDTMPVGIPCRWGYHAGGDTMPVGIPRRVGHHAALGLQVCRAARVVGAAA